MVKGHVTRGNFPCNLQRTGVPRVTSSCDTPCLQLVSQRKIALQVAEKVEAASTSALKYFKGTSTLKSTVLLS